MTSIARGVRTTHPEYEEMLPLWQTCEDAAEGEHEIHAAGAKYLPMLAEEGKSDYKARKDRTPFFNATWRTISGLKGMLFRRAPVLEAPPAVVNYLADVDMAGTPLDIFVQDLCEEVLTVGRSIVLVDYAQAPAMDGQTVTVHVAESLGLRPKMVMYEADDAINWKYSRINGAMQLSLLVLKECAAAQGADEYSQDEEEQYLVLDLSEGYYRQRRFVVREEKDVQIGADIFPTMKGQQLNYIPAIVFGVDGISADIETPPLLDLVQMNLHHYTVSADYEHGCHFSGLPTGFISGYTPPESGGKIYIGGSSFNALPDPMAKAYYCETVGSMTALRDNLDAKKQEMAVLGAKMLEEHKKSVESAESLAQRTAGEQSQLAAMAQIVSMGITKALRIFSDWAGQSGDVKYTVNNDFGVSGMTPLMLTALVGAWQAGMPGASDENVYAIMQKQEMADATVTFEEEQGRMQSRQPALFNSAPLPTTAAQPAQSAPADFSGLIDALHNMPAPVVNVAAPVINIPAAVVNMPEQPAANIVVNTPPITIQPASITVNNVEGGKTMSLQYDAEGNVVGGTVSPA